MMNEFYPRYLFTAYLWEMMIALDFLDKNSNFETWRLFPGNERSFCSLMKYRYAIVNQYIKMNKY